MSLDSINTKYVVLSISSSQRSSSWFCSIDKPVPMTGLQYFTVMFPLEKYLGILNTSYQHVPWPTSQVSLGQVHLRNSAFGLKLESRTVDRFATLTLWSI